VGTPEGAGAPAHGRDQGPELPDDVDPRELDQSVRAELRSLAKPVADRVSRHLVMAGQLLDEEPLTALEHALAARRQAPRIAAVREAAGLAAYKAGEWHTAVSELRAYHRMSGQQAHLSILADCERALGRPERAVDMFRTTDRTALAPAEAVELLIVAAGARGDLGQQDAAVSMLQVRELTPAALAPWTPRLRYAYADALLSAGRRDEAREWFARAAEIDEDATTDAAERLLELDGVLLDEAEDDDSDLDAEDGDAGHGDEDINGEHDGDEDVDAEDSDFDDDEDDEDDLDGEDIDDVAAVEGEADDASLDAAETDDAPRGAGGDDVEVDVAPADAALDADLVPDATATARADAAARADLSVDGDGDGDPGKDGGDEYRQAAGDDK